MFVAPVWAVRKGLAGKADLAPVVESFEMSLYEKQMSRRVRPGQRQELKMVLAGLCH
jgi:hypothetical protein